MEKKFIMIDANICNRLRKNHYNALENFLQMYPEERYTTVSEDFAVYEYIGLNITSPLITLAEINKSKIILNDEELSASKHLPEKYYDEISNIKGAARFHYREKITESFVESKITDCLSYCSEEFKNSYLNREIFGDMMLRGAKSIASNLVELLAADFINTYKFSSIDIQKIHLSLGLIGMGYEIHIERRNVQLLRFISMFWTYRDKKIEFDRDVTSETITFVESGIKSIKNSKDYLDLELLNAFLMGFNVMAEAYPVEIITQDRKEEVLSRLIVAYSFIIQVKKEMNTMKELEEFKDIDFRFLTEGKYTFVNDSCRVIDTLSYKDLFTYMLSNKIITSK